MQTTTVRKQASIQPCQRSCSARRAPRLRWPLVLSSLAMFTGTAVVGPFASASDDPRDDEFLRPYIEDPAPGLFRVNTCRSVAEDGSVIEDEDELPVGGGRRLECETFPMSHQVTFGVRSSTEEEWCFRYDIISTRGETAYPNLRVSVADTPEGEPWLLVATLDGPETTVRRPSGTSFAIAVAVDYTVELENVRPNPDLLACADLYDR